MIEKRKKKTIVVDQKTRGRINLFSKKKENHKTDTKNQTNLN